jgi:hypothetical protein
MVAASTKQLFQHTAEGLFTVFHPSPRVAAAEALGVSAASHTLPPPRHACTNPQFDFGHAFVWGGSAVGVVNLLPKLCFKIS